MKKGSVPGITFALICAVVLQGCGPGLSRVRATYAPDLFNTSAPERVRLRALSAPAKTGLLEGESSAAWFSFDSNFSRADLFPRAGDSPEADTSGLTGARPDDPPLMERPRSLEVRLLNEAADPVRVSLAPVYASDLGKGGSLVDAPGSRHLSEVSGLVGRFRLSMILSSRDDDIAGFAVQLSGTAASRVRIESVSIERARTGWRRDAESPWAGFGPGGGTIDASLSSAPDLAIPVPEHAVLELVFAPSGPDEMGSSIRPGRTVFSRDGQKFGFRSSPVPHIASLPGFLPPLGGGKVMPPVDSRRLTGMKSLWWAAPPAVRPNDPLSPIPADPFTILEWPRERWRNPEREVFSWDRFPSILVFDTASYAVQDRLFKRLAFYVEKGGYRGRLLTNGEMTGLHGFNAHDYRSESLAAFFEAARKSGFELNREELELRTILIDSGILLRDGESFREGTGVVLSVSRESVDYLRYLFVNHEGLHGLYFTDPGFRSEVSRVYHSMDERAIGFLEGYFSIIDSLDYDVTDRYLMENEFMAYVMQQPYERVESYFSVNLLERFVRHKGSAVLAEYIAETKASEFVRAAKELDEYVFTRWGLSSGRVGLWFSY